MRQKIASSEIPMHRGGGDGVETFRSDQPLIVAWKERNNAVERVVRVRPLDLYDVQGGYPNQFDEALDLEDDREHSFRKQIVWFVSRLSEKFKQAEKELYMIHNFYVDAHNLFFRGYGIQKQKLLDAGYALADIEAVSAPPAGIPALHLENSTCGGEIHTGTPKEGMYKSSTSTFCTKCGWVFIGSYGPKISVEQLEDIGVKLIPQNPDAGYSLSSSDADEISSEELRREAQEAQAYTCRCMKAAKTLISVSEAAGILYSTTQNISNYIAKQRLHSWIDPDDTRYRLVLREEVEELASLQKNHQLVRKVGE